MFLTFLTRRLAGMVPVLLGLSLLIFSLVRVMPGDPVRLALGPDATADQIAQYAQELGLDRSLPEQYLRWIGGMLQGDMGKSLRTNRNVSLDVKELFPATLELVLVAMVATVVLGVPLGVVAAVKKDKWPDHLSRVLSLAGVAMPRFWLAILMQLLFSAHLGWLPAVGRGAIAPARITGLYLIDSLLTWNGAAFASGLLSLLLPALALALPSVAQVMRLTRSNMVEETRRDYSLAARAYGIPPFLVVFKYMLKNAFTSTLTVLGLTFGYMLGNAFLVEVVFSWPGMASYGVDAVLYNDFNAVTAVTMVIGLVFLLTNLMVDLLYGWFDPRIKYA